VQENDEVTCAWIFVLPVAIETVLTITAAFL
jgi:hypothetical protein